MNLGFTETVVHKTESPVGDDLTEQLLSIAHNHTNFQYTCEKKEDGYWLRPTFKNMPYRNSFVPEIHVALGWEGDQRVFTIQGRPVKSVRIFMTIWFFSLLPHGIIGLFAMEGIPRFIPLFMAVFGYLLCKLGGRRTFYCFREGFEKYFLNKNNSY